MYMRTFKLTLAYDGTAYAGWQRQFSRPSVQETLEKALEKITGERVRALASGRTDAGVHALGQVVSVRTNSSLPPEALCRALNANLPPDIAVLDAALVPNDFHPIRDARRKRYRYVIHDGPTRDVFLRRYAWHFACGRLDADAMRRAARPLLGTHDFRSFESSGAERKTSVRTVFELSVERGRAGGRESGIGDSEFEMQRPATAVAGEDSAKQGRAGPPHVFPHAEREEYVVLEIEADGFLYNMVRSIVGTLVEVGRGARPESWPGEVLVQKDRRAAGPTAPPQGLFLVRVEYAR